MAIVEVSVVISAPTDRVWSDLEDIASHVEWMADAESIEFTSDQTRGVGTRFDCRTRIGPLRTVDAMVITEWEPGRRMGVDHVGMVRGSGRFLLDAVGEGATKLTWQEHLRFPWRLGGPVAAGLSRPIFTWIWRRNLERLADRIVVL